MGHCFESQDDITVFMAPIKVTLDVDWGLNHGNWSVLIKAVTSQ